MSLLHNNFLRKLWENVKTFPSPKQVLKWACTCELVICYMSLSIQIVLCGFTKMQCRYFSLSEKFLIFYLPFNQSVKSIGVGSTIQLWSSCWAHLELFVHLLQRSPVNRLTLVIYNFVPRGNIWNLNEQVTIFFFFKCLWLKLLFLVNELRSWPSPEYGLVSWQVLGSLGPLDVPRVHATKVPKSARPLSVLQICNNFGKTSTFRSEWTPWVMKTLSVGDFSAFI